MKKHIIAALLLTASSAFATVTLTFGGTTTYASNWGNANDVGGNLMAWGIVIDASGNGFDSNYNASGVNFATTNTLTSLKQSDGTASDDVLFISSALMLSVPNTNDGGVIGDNRITGVVGVTYGGLGVDAGDKFRIIWFTRTAANNTGSPTNGEEYGVFDNVGLVLPPDGGTTPFLSVFTGADPLKTMTQHFVVPEPSSMLLGLLGAAGLIRRRRR